MTRLRSLGPVACLVVAAALLAGCSDDSSDADRDEPSAALSDALRDASSGGEPEDAVPEVVALVAAESTPLPDKLSAAVLDVLADHPDALRAAAGPRAPGMEEPSVELDDDALDALVKAGGDDDAAEAFRAAYLDYVRTGVEQTIRAGSGDWDDTLDAIDEIWIEPSAEVIGAVEAGCDESGGTCSERLDRAETETRDAVEAATYVAIPAKLLPQIFLAGSTRVPMADWSAQQRDAWQRLRDTTLLPQTGGSVERAAHARRQSTGA